MKLTENKCSDPRLFDFCRYLTSDQACCAAKVDAAMQKFPISDREASVTLVLSHRLRMSLCKQYNDKAKNSQSIFIKATKQHSASNPPQDFWCYPGQLLLVCTEGKNKKNFYNGLFVRVQSTSSERVVVQGSDLEPVSLSLAEAAKNLRLCSAICYAAVQGLTIQGLIRLRDVKNHRFTTRHLLVGMSRATAASLVEVGI